jgi:hypothetical protein
LTATTTATTVVIMAAAKGVGATAEPTTRPMRRSAGVLDRRLGGFALARTKVAFNSQLARQVGEHLLVAELGRRGVVATPFAGNVPDIDVLAYANGRTLAIQVKALSRGDWSLRADDYLDLNLADGVQTIAGLRQVNRDLIMVFVMIGARAGDDLFYICTAGDVQDRIHQHYAVYLERWGGRRPKNPDTMHTSLLRAHVEPFLGRWDTILRRLGLEAGPEPAGTQTAG